MRESTVECQECKNPSVNSYWVMTSAEWTRLHWEDEQGVVFQFNCAFHRNKALWDVTERQSDESYFLINLPVSLVILQLWPTACECFVFLVEVNHPLRRAVTWTRFRCFFHLWKTRNGWKQDNTARTSGRDAARREVTPPPQITCSGLISESISL